MASADSPAASHLTTPLVCDPREPRVARWEAEAAESFRKRMLDPDALFPCVFGVDALRKATLRYSFIGHGPDTAARLAAALTDFVELAPLLGRRTSLVTFFEGTPEDATATIEEFHDHVWQLLQSVHELDKTPWPAEIPSDTEHPEWEYSFAGMPMFVVANTPAHVRRASRYFDRLAITFQPRFVFDDIGEDSKQGRNARNVIRGRLASYDDVPASPLLGSFGKPGNREWAQYFLDDTNGPSAHARCPMRMTSTDDRADKS